MLNQNLLLGDDGYLIQRSLRFRSSASAYLSRTPASAGNLTTWTYSFWFKIGVSGNNSYFLGAGNQSTTTEWLTFSTDQLSYVLYNGSSFLTNIQTTQVFRDPSAWYHIVLAVDTTQATASNRVKIYVNGNQVTAFGTSTYPSQNTNSYFGSTLQNLISKESRGAYYGDSYMAEVNYVNGQALTPSSFGQNDPVTGVWQPKKYSGTYGTNGFYLPFSDNSSTTNLCLDKSGNGNNWTPNNISVTAGATYDSMTDVPTLTSASAANYCVMNPLNQYSSTSLSNANLRFTSSAAAFQSASSTIAVSSGKWYWEITCGTTSANGTVIGISNPSTNYINNNNYIGQASDSYSYYSANGQKINNNTGASYGATFTTGDIIGVALDLNAGTLEFYKNNTSQGVAYTGISGTFCPAVSVYDSSRFVDANFGQRPFAYTPPTGFVALNTFNLPDATIKAGNKHFDATTYSGTTGVLSVTNTGAFQPDLVWIKVRSITGSNVLQDSVRGTTTYLQSNATSAENTNTANDWFRSFNSNGFTVSSSTTGGTSTSEWNSSGQTYVGWQWKANGSAVSNTAGSITSQVSANPTAGFSVVTFTTPASGNFTVGHGLGVAPSMFILKTRSAADGWYVYHKNLSTPASNYLTLNATSASASSTSIWGNTNPTSSVLTLGTNAGIAANATGVLYCFSEVAGYSKFGSYTGNGSADGVFLYFGFKPKFVMVKRTDTLGSWHIIDASRSPYNQVGLGLYPDLSSAESADFNSDILSNGLKIRNTQGEINTSGGTYIFMAFAESPFKNSLAR